MTGEIKIDVKEINGKFASARLHIALGPWPMKNWDWAGKYYWNLDQALKDKKDLEAIKNKELRYWAYIDGAPFTEEKGRECFKRHKDRKVNEYSIR